MLIDSHCHVPCKGYEKGIGDIVSDAEAQGVVKLINIGTSIKENKKVLDISKDYKNIFPVTGIYPHEDMDLSVESLREKLEEIIKSSDRVVGIGECGIDISNWQGGRAPVEQEKVFDMQIKLALNFKLPLVIHNRNGDKEIIKMLREYKTSSGSNDLRGVIHCFSSSWENAQEFLKLGFYISFSGMITYPSRKDLLETVEKIPLDRFLVETDAPYLPPQGHRGEPNYPEYVKIVAEKVAQVKQKPFDEIAQWSYKNTCTLFSL